MYVIYLKRKVQILWKINPSHLLTHPPRVDHLGATHMETPFPIEPGRCPVPFFFHAETPGVFTTGGLRLSPGSFWNFSFLFCP